MVDEECCSECFEQSMSWLENLPNRKSRSREEWGDLQEGACRGRHDGDWEL